MFHIRIRSTESSTIRETMRTSSDIWILLMEAILSRCRTTRVLESKSLWDLERGSFFTQGSEMYSYSWRKGRVSSPRKAWVYILPEKPRPYILPEINFKLKQFLGSNITKNVYTYILSSFWILLYFRITFFLRFIQKSCQPKCFNYYYIIAKIPQ